MLDACGYFPRFLHFASCPPPSPPEKRLQYFDMLRDVGQSSRSSTVFLPHAPQNVGQLQAAMRNGFMEVRRAMCLLPDGAFRTHHSRLPR